MLLTHYGFSVFHAFCLLFLSILHLSLYTLLVRAYIIQYLYIFSEVKVVAVFDAMMSELPTHKETFEGYFF